MLRCDRTPVMLTCINRRWAPLGGFIVFAQFLLGGHGPCGRVVIDDHPLAVALCVYKAVPGREALAFPVLVVSLGKLQQGLGQMRNAYIERRYLNFTPVPDSNIDESHHVISVVVDCDEGKQFRQFTLDC
jgi:hypothetical protein